MPHGPAFWALAAQTGSAIECPMTPTGTHPDPAQGLARRCLRRPRPGHGGEPEDSLHRHAGVSCPRTPLGGLGRPVTAVRARDEGLAFQRRRRRLTLSGRGHTVPASSVATGLPRGVGDPIASSQLRKLGQSWCGELVRGLYVVEVPDAEDPHGLQAQAVGPVEQTIAERGDPARPPDPERCSPSTSNRTTPPPASSPSTTT